MSQQGAEPALRSAKLLAEDLGRYIDGEPILGRRVSLSYRLRRLAQRHRALVAVSAVFFVVLSGLVGSSIRQYLVSQRERARVAAQALLERELTQQIKDLEWFLRTAYQLPLHDIGEEQAIVRQRMAALPVPSVALGELGWVWCTTRAAAATRRCTRPSPPSKSCGWRSKKEWTVRSCTTRW